VWVDETVEGWCRMDKGTILVDRLKNQRYVWPLDHIAQLTGDSVRQLLLCSMKA
jgi:hypothetical protein